VQKLSTIYDAICNDRLIEQLYQTDAKEIWFKAIDTLRQIYTEMPVDGIVLSHNVNLLSAQNLHTWLFTPAHTALLATNFESIALTQVIQLTQDDPLIAEQFCILLTETFSIIIANNAANLCWFSLHPEVVQQVLDQLIDRITDPTQIELLANQLQQFPISHPPYQVMARFGSLLLSQSVSQEVKLPEIQEVDIILALAHEVRTPLTTIRTLIRSVLRRTDVSPGIRLRLESVDRECTEQVDRFNLIFEAAQLTADPVKLHETYIADILHQNLARWQKQASRRQLTLTLRIAQNMPPVSSNADLLTQVLNGLVDRLTRSLPIDSDIQIQVAAVGEHIKLQFLSQLKYPSIEHLAHNSQMLTAVGQWLMLQPETGSLSLSLPITKTLFQALGGKLTVRLLHAQRSPDAAIISETSSEILTIFLPVYKPT